MFIVLFGLAGSGKNFVGKILEQHFNYFFWDADEALTEEMQDCIHNKKSFTQDMRDQFTKATILKTADLRKKHTNLAVAQALYKEKNREEILNAFPDALFINITADSKIISQHLNARRDDVDEDYANKIAKNFELPIVKHSVLINNDDELAVIEQLKKILIAI